MKHKMRWVAFALISFAAVVALTTGQALDIASGHARAWTDGALLVVGIVMCLFEAVAVLRFAWVEEKESE